MAWSLKSHLVVSSRRDAHPGPGGRGRCAGVGLASRQGHSANCSIIAIAAAMKLQIKSRMAPQGCPRLQPRVSELVYVLEERKRWRSGGLAPPPRPASPSAADAAVQKFKRSEDT